MKDCEQVQDRLGAWIDGELSPTDSESVGNHLGGCADCRTAQQRLEKMNSALRRVLAADADKIEFTPFWQNVEQGIKEKRRWYARVQDWGGSVFAAPRTAWAVPAAIAIVLVAISASSYLSKWRGGNVRNNFASVDSIDAYGRSVALLREDDTKTTVIWLFQNQEGEHEAEESSPSGPAF